MAQHGVPLTAAALYSSMVSLSAAQQAMLTAISRHREHVTVTELAEELDLHPNSVRMTLDSLVELRLIDREPIKGEGRGRPAWGYFSLAPSSSAFTAAYFVELTNSFCDAIREYSPDPVGSARQLGKAWADRIFLQLARTAGGDGADTEADSDHTHRVAAMRMLYSSMGTSASIDDDSSALDLHSCPFVHNGSVDPLMCEIHAGMSDQMMKLWYDESIAATLYPQYRDGVCRIQMRAVTAPYSPRAE
ncbi:helix-turn-helix transcriptional regulator [Trueperella sp. LYQ141]|uniref:helix-turn-helix transcriptional regulator n=1 Tax=Trueperella sp. LYQ141 TaxID=3391058 RepID=UPI003983C4D7